MSQLEKFGLDENKVISSLISTIPCEQNEFDECELEELRNRKCFSCNKTEKNNSFQGSCFKAGNDIFKNALEKGDYICCGITIGAFAGIMAAVFVVIIIIVIVLVCSLRKVTQKRAVVVRKT